MSFPFFQTFSCFSWLGYNADKNPRASQPTIHIKGTISSRSEQTLNRAWNRCPCLRWTQWLKKSCLINAAATVIWPYLYHVGYYFQLSSWSKTSIPIPCPVDRDDTIPIKGSYIIAVVDKTTSMIMLTFFYALNNQPVKVLSLCCVINKTSVMHRFSVYIVMWNLGKNTF